MLMYFFVWQPRRVVANPVNGHIYCRNYFSHILFLSFILPCCFLLPGLKLHCRSSMAANVEAVSMWQAALRHKLVFIDHTPFFCYSFPFLPCLLNEWLSNRRSHFSKKNLQNLKVYNQNAFQYFRFLYSVSHAKPLSVQELQLLL